MRITSIGTLAAAVLAVGTAPAVAAQPACGDVVTADVWLQADLVDCPGHGLVIGADGVDVDLNGHTIDGVRPGDGIGIDNSAGHDGVRVYGGTIKSFGSGVVLTGADDAVLRRLTVTSNGAGVTAAASDRLRIELSSVTRNSVAMRQGSGILLRDGSDDAQIHEVVSTENEGLALRVLDSPRARIERFSTADEDEWVGVHRSPGTLVRSSSLSGGLGVTDSAHARVLGNEMRAIYGGLHVGGSSARTLIRGNVVENQSVAMSVDGADRVRIEDNRVRSGLEEGIVIDGTRARLLNNVVRSGGFQNGILVTAGAARAYLERNTVSGAYLDGIHIDTPDAVLRGNVAFGNRQLGIYAVRGVKSRGWNYAWDNGDERQCVFVLCRTK